MNKGQIDELYHQLRELSLTDDITQKDAIKGLVTHLTKSQGDYPGLLRYLDYYGEKYILPEAVKLMKSASRKLKFSRIVELGAGLGWLGRGISNAYSQMPVVYVDKRQYMSIDVVADIETKNGIKRVLDVVEEGDFIIMSEILHCLENPREVLRPFTKYPLLVVEYYPEKLHYMQSYITQIKKLGCTPFNSIRDVFPGGAMLSVSIDTHMIWLILPLE